MCVPLLLWLLARRTIRSGFQFAQLEMSGFSLLYTWNSSSGVHCVSSEVVACVLRSFKFLAPDVSDSAARQESGYGIESPQCLE